MSTIWFYAQHFSFQDTHTHILQPPSLQDVRLTNW